jgi:hypothetical protein
VTAINHALTGATIGLVSGRPLIAVPTALVSHFICDALPHFGIQENQQRWLSSRFFHRYLITDALGCICLVGILAFTQPQYWLLAAICAFVATSPDFLWIPKFLAAKGKRREWSNWFTRFAVNIQWFQRPIGIVVEVVWFVGFTTIIAQFL